MLGFYALSRAPLSSLANVAFFVAATEDVSVADANVVTRGYTDTLAENLGLASTQTATAAFLNSLSENVVVDTTVVGGISSVFSITENLTQADAYNFAAQFTSSVTEDSILGFSSVAGNAYYASVAENSVLANSSVEAKGYLFTLAENLNPADSASTTTQYNTSITEGSTVRSIQYITAQFLTTINENTGEASIEGIAGGFAVQPVENLTVQDVISYFHYPVSVGWTPINTDIYTYGSGALMFGGATFAQIPFSGYTGDSSIVVPAWTDGSCCTSTTTQVVWEDINNNAIGTSTAAGIMFGGTAFSTTAISGLSGTSTIIGPGWKDIVNN